MYTVENCLPVCLNPYCYYFKDLSLITAKDRVMLTYIASYSYTLYSLGNSIHIYLTLLFAFSSLVLSCQWCYSYRYLSSHFSVASEKCRKRPTQGPMNYLHSHHHMLICPITIINVGSATMTVYTQ